VNAYDSARDPVSDLQQAVLFAQKENKRIMLELVATLKWKYAGKPLFAANCTDFREFQKNPCKLA
jgi:hypothetical protein